MIFCYLTHNVPCLLISRKPPSRGYRQRTHLWARAAYPFDRQREGIDQGGIVLVCVMVCNVDMPDQSLSACIHMIPSCRLEVGRAGTLRVVSLTMWGTVRLVRRMPHRSCALGI